MRAITVVNPITGDSHVLKLRPGQKAVQAYDKWRKSINFPGTKKQQEERIDRKAMAILLKIPMFARKRLT